MFDFESHSPWPRLAILCLAATVLCTPAFAQSPDSTRIPLITPSHPAPGDTIPAADVALEQYRRGRAFEERGMRGAALASYQNCVRADPTFPDAYFRLGLLFLDGGNVEEARQCFAAELKHHPKNADASRELGLALARLGRAKEGLPRLEAYRDSHLREGLAWYALGFCYQQVGRTADAEKALRKAVAIGPPNPAWHRDLGVVLAARGATEEARREYAIALEIAPENPTPLINLGNLERQAGHAEQALAAYRRAEAIDSTLHIALYGQAQVLRDLGRHDEAAATYKRWLRRRPGDHAARLDAVQFFQSIGRPEDGLEIARDGVKKDPHSGDAHMVLGIALKSEGHEQQAVEELRRAHDLFRTPAERERVTRLIASIERGDSTGTGRKP